MNPKDVEEFMKSIGFKWDDDAVSWNNGSADGKKFIELSTVPAAFLYQQTLEARRDELDRLPISGVITAGGYRHDGASEHVIKKRLAELTQLLQGGKSAD